MSHDCYGSFSWCRGLDFAVFLTGKRELVALLWLSSMSSCLVAVGILWLFLPAPWDGMQCVIVVFHDHTHLLFTGRHRKLDI